MSRHIVAAVVLCVLLAPHVRAETLPLVLPKPQFCSTPLDWSRKFPRLARPRGTVAIPAPAGIQNLALHKPVASSDCEPTVGALKQITDGDKEGAEGSYVELGPGMQWVQVDLKQPCDLHYIVLWHFHKEPRVCRDVVVQVADDVDFITNVRTLYNNDTDNSAGLGLGTNLEYIDSYEGLLVKANAVTARYIRTYSKGNSSNDQNHYTEIEAWGFPAK